MLLMTLSPTLFLLTKWSVVYIYRINNNNNNNLVLRLACATGPHFCDAQSGIRQRFSTFVLGLCYSPPCPIRDSVENARARGLQRMSTLYTKDLILH